MKSKKIIIVIFFIIMCVSVLLIEHNQNRFSDQCIKNQDYYLLNINQMSGKDKHTLNLTTSNILQIEFKTEKGKLQLEITSPKGDIIYSGNGTEISNFELNIPQDGTYSIIVKGQNAKGIIQIKVK